ncbi:MmcQ/YjbR family DNA-binding protein [Microbacterium gorillae]|uniref:MmcQ/YjbR family DNA-binding protein n=1 Tax=Microbacterium gorillae TaxID=1231063 RepID=UPI00058AEFF8|nr:MmcQ/YjbR family DNA-binding protein [Microbacterium gorillae]
MSDLHAWTAARAEELPGSELRHPFGPETDVFAVRDKLFMFHVVRHGSGIVVLKCRPTESEALRATFPEITPGYHMNKRHWITLNPGALERDLVVELVTESYRLVVAGLPRAIRPVDPETFGLADLPSG